MAANHEAALSARLRCGRRKQKSMECLRCGNRRKASCCRKLLSKVGFSRGVRVRVGLSVILTQPTSLEFEISAIDDCDGCRRCVVVWAVDDSGCRRSGVFRGPVAAILRWVQQGVFPQAPSLIRSFFVSCTQIGCFPTSCSASGWRTSRGWCRYHSHWRR